MALNINTNIAALRAQNQLNKTSQKLQKSLERLSSGLRINWAADDAAGLAIADGLKATATGLAQAIRNANEGISLIKVADGALIEYGNILNTIKEKVVQAANATQNAETRKSIQRDINKLLAELNNIARTTEFNGQKLLSGSFVNKKFQIGSASYVTATLNIRSAETNAVGGTKTSIMNLNSIGDVQLTITNASSGISVTTEKIQLLYNNSAENGAGALANEINRYSGATGVTAVAVVESTSDVIQAGTISGLKINGVTIGDITVQAADADGALVNAINAKSLETGVTASVTEDGKLVLTSTDGRAIKVEAESGLNTVLGKTAQELSTLGHIRLIQKGVADFQITGMDGTGIGADITIDSNDTVTIDGTSTLEEGSTIAHLSKLGKGSVVGGDVNLAGNIWDSENAISVKEGSVINAGSKLAKGTVVTGDVLVAGNDEDSISSTSFELEQDMLVTAGSTLAAGTVIGEGTVVYGSLASALGVTDGSTISGSSTLSEDVTLDTDIVLKYNASNDSKIAAGSILASGSKLGVDLTVGYTWNKGSTTSLDLNGAGTGSNVIPSGTNVVYDVSKASYTTDSATVTIGGNTILKTGTIIKLGTDTDSTADSVTIKLTADSGESLVLVGKDSSGNERVLTATSSDSATLVLSNDESFTITQDVFLDGGTLELILDNSNLEAMSLTIAAESYLDSYKQSVAAASGGSLELAKTVQSLTNATFTKDTELLKGTNLINGSKLATGSKFGDDAYVREFTSDEDATVVTKGSVLKGGSELKQGSVLDTDDLKLNENVTLSADMTLAAGTKLTEGTKFAAGTMLTQELTFYTNWDGSSFSGTKLTLAAGTVLDQDLYLWVDGSGGAATLTNDLVLAEGSVIRDSDNTELVLTPTGEMSDVETKKLSDINVLTYESAQLAVTIVEAAISDVDGIRAELGSVQNQLESTVANISVTQVNVQAAESSIREVDFAAESANFTKMQVLMQAGMFALAQSNTLPQMAIQLLQS